MNRNRNIKEKNLSTWEIQVCLATVAIVGLVCAVHAAELDKLVGRPADIAPSAYQYRADRKPEENPPESWIGLMQFLNAPQDRPLVTSKGEFRKVLCSLLWEEVRPVNRIELVWPSDVKNRPATNEIALAYLDGTDGHAHFWWNPIDPVCKTQYTPPKHPQVKWVTSPQVSADGLTYTFAVSTTWNVVAILRGEKEAAAYVVPTIRAFTACPWKKTQLEIEWGFKNETSALDYDGTLEVYDGVIGGIQPLTGDTGTRMTGANQWRSSRKGDARRGIRVGLLHIGSSGAPQVRTIVTVRTKSGSFSFKVADAEKEPVLAPEYGFFVGAVSSTSGVLAARDFVADLAGRGLKTIRERVRDRAEMKPEDALAKWSSAKVPFPSASVHSPMQIAVPDDILGKQWQLGAGHLLVGSVKQGTGKRTFKDSPYGILGTETFMILHALDVLGMHQEAADGLDQWLTLPLQPMVEPGKGGHHTWARPDRPLGLYSDGKGCLTHAVGPNGVGDHMDGVHCTGPGSIMFALSEHFRLTGDTTWLKANAPRMKANADWIVRQRKLLQSIIPGGERLWCKGLQPASMLTPDVAGLYHQFYTIEAYYCLAVKRMAELLLVVDPAEGARMETEAEAYRHDLLAALERSITLTPVMRVQDGTYRSYIPFAPYVRGPAEDPAWQWQRPGIPSYWDLVQSAAPTISPAGVLKPDDPRVHGYFDVLEDRLFQVWTKSYGPWKNRLLKNTEMNAGEEWYYFGGVGHQAGFEQQTSIYLERDEIKAFLRGLFVGYAAEVVPSKGYIFMEGAPHTAAQNKVFEEAAFLVRLRSMLVSEQGDTLWLARGTPRAWLEQGKRIAVKDAPTYFGPLAYEIVSDADKGKINATVEVPARNAPKEILLRLRHPKAAPIKAVTVNGKEWKDFDAARETVKLTGLGGKVAVTATYQAVKTPRSSEGPATMPTSAMERWKAVWKEAPAAAPADGIMAPAEQCAEAQAWAAAVFGAAKEDASKARTLDLLFSSRQPPFSFTYGGTSSADLLGKWTHTHEARDLDDRVEHTAGWTDEATGLRITAVAMAYKRYPAVEWVLYFENTGKADTPILENIQALDVRLHTAGKAAVLHRIAGDTCEPKSFQPLQTAVEAGKPIRLAPVGGRSSNGTFPFFNLACGEQGVFTAIGWSGQWAAGMDMGTDGSLRVTSGMEQTHLVLHPGEKIRTPRILLMAWKGDRMAAHNRYRRLMLHHYSPQLDGRPVMLPSFWQCFDRYNGNPQWTTEAGQTQAATTAAACGVEFHWLDASWFPGHFPNGVGNNWVTHERLPRGLRPVSDAVHKLGLGFILWFEPERVAKGTKIAVEHPEWVYGGANGGLFKLDDPKARRWMTDLLLARIKEYGLDWYRNDFNMDPLKSWRANDAGDRQGMTEIRYIEGLYAMWDELREKNPGLIIDNCASGGRRIDLETVSRSVALWQSDINCRQGSEDAHQAQNVCLSTYIPLHTACAWQPNSYELRSVVTAGLVLQLPYLEAGFDAALARKLVDEVKQYRKFWYGDLYPLTPISPEADKYLAFALYRPDLGEGLAMCFRRAKCVDQPLELKLPMLDADREYWVWSAEGLIERTRKTGRELMTTGVTLKLPGPRTSDVVRFREVGKDEAK